MAEEKALIRSLEGKALWLTINRPKAFNALNSEVFQGIREGLAEAEANPNIAVVVITGAGEKAFSAGADIKDTLPFLKEHRDAPWGFPDIPMRGLDIWKPLIAAINGFANSSYIIVFYIFFRIPMIIFSSIYDSIRKAIGLQVYIWSYYYFCHRLSCGIITLARNPACLTGVFFFSAI